MMLARRAIHGIWRLIGVVLWGAPADPPRTRSEFPLVNAIAGIEPLRPELSGLRVRYPAGMPRRLFQIAIELAYRWTPSREYLRRQEEIRWVNGRIKRWVRERLSLPPVLTYSDDTEISPIRMQPSLVQQAERRTRHLPRDLSDLDRMEQSRRLPVLQPRLSEADPVYLLTYRRLIPRRFRQFLLHSPYPRTVAGLLMGLAMVFSALWVSQLHQAEAVASGRVRIARHALRSELDVARSFGVNPRLLQPLEIRFHALAAVQAPGGFSIGGARTRFYGLEERRYTALLGSVHRLERQTLQYWTRTEAATYAALVEVTQKARRLGVQSTLPAMSVCDTARCYRRAVVEQHGRVAWLHQTMATLRVYASSIAASQDPADAANNYLQAARDLTTILPGVAALPVRQPNLDGMYATASGPTEYARVGALAHLDVDVLRRQLVRTLPRRAMVVSIEDQTVTAYQDAKAVVRSPIVTAAATPTGVFHIQGKQPAVSAVYWSGSGSRRAEAGSLPDWMAFSGDAALQAAPWRTAFGSAGATRQPTYAPSTPRSIDLPPAVAQKLFRWASIGTEVVIY
jgi:hypothetical protein